MNKAELVDTLANEMKLTPTVSKSIVHTILDEMTNALAKGDGVEIRGFGSFTIREYESYTGRNPKTGEKLNIPPKKLPFFKVGKHLAERVDR